MAIECEFRENGVILWHSGVVTGQDLIEINSVIYSHRYPAGLRFQLMDLSKVEKFDVSSTAMQIVASTDRNVKKEYKQFACVVAPSDVTFGISRAWGIQSEADDFEGNVVRSMDEAIAWFKSKGIII